MSRMARSSDPEKLQLWQGRFRRFLDSGLAVARFCAVEDVSESSFYYWQKKLRRQALFGPQTLLRPARAEGCGVFRPVTVLPTACGVVVRLPGGVRIEVDANPLDAIRAVVAETVRPEMGRVDHGRAAERNVSSDNQVIRKASPNNQAIRQRGGAVSC